MAHTPRARPPVSPHGKTQRADPSAQPQSSPCACLWHPRGVQAPGWLGMVPLSPELCARSKAHFRGDRRRCSAKPGESCSPLAGPPAACAAREHLQRTERSSAALPARHLASWVCVCFAGVRDCGLLASQAHGPSHSSGSPYRRHRGG